jgi:hypothetical protein
MSLMASQDAFQYFWTGFEMLRLGKSRPSVDQITFSLKTNLAKIKLNASFMDSWLKNVMAVKKLPKPSSWMQSLRGRPTPNFSVWHKFILHKTLQERPLTKGRRRTTR